MPRKIRELKSELLQAGFARRPGKGSHTVWRHPLIRNKVTLSGSDGDDAQPYQEKDLRAALEALQNAQRRTP